VQISGNKAVIHLSSDTPNLKEYQMKKPGGEKWIPVEDSLGISLNNQAEEVFNFRTINLAGVAGPIHQVLITRE
jgi:hypothetical protein